MLFCLNFPDTENYSPERIKRFIKKSQSTTVYVKYMLNVYLISLSALTGICLFCLFLQSTVIIFVFIKYKKIAWAQSFCILFVLGQFFSITIAGLDDMDRHLIPAYPFIIQIAASYLAVLIAFLKKEKVENVVLP